MIVFWSPEKSEKSRSGGRQKIIIFRLQILLRNWNDIELILNWIEMNWTDLNLNGLEMEMEWNWFEIEIEVTWVELIWSEFESNRIELNWIELESTWFEIELIWITLNQIVIK